MGTIGGRKARYGAGKSTTIRILLGLARGTGGEAAVFGARPSISSRGSAV